MIGLDTNVLVRYFAQDDPAQTLIATRVFGDLTVDEPGFIAVPALVEMVWVLRGIFKGGRDRIAQVVADLLSSDTLILEHPREVREALAGFLKGRADFADYLIERRSAVHGCLKTLTFDKNASRSPGFERL